MSQPVNASRPCRHHDLTTLPNAHMSNITLQHVHALPPDQARHAVQHMADVLQSRFGLACHWQGDDCLAFKRASIDGTITLSPGQLQLTARLGFPISLMQAQIETEIQRVLQERF